jgi:uncharacterized membrane protein
MEERNTSGTVEAGEAATAPKATERLTFFSDAVVAIAMTLLAIDLPVPTGATTAEFLHSLDEGVLEYLCFLVSFAVIGAHWRAHHGVFRYVDRADGPVVLLNLLWLLLVVLTPFLTRVLGEGESVVFVRFGMYATPVSLSGRGWVAALISAVAFAVSVPAFLLIGPWAFALWLVLPVALHRISQRTGITARP